MEAPNAYKESLKKQPNYHDGSIRKTWNDLGSVEKSSWTNGVDGWCPRCERAILGYELSTEYDGELFHIDCAADEMDEICFDDDFGANG